MNRIQRILYLLVQFRKNSLNPHEEEELRNWKNSSEENEKIYHKLLVDPNLDALKELEAYDVEHSLKQLKQQMRIYKPKPSILKPLLVAASLTLLVGLSVLFYLQNNKSTDNPLSEHIVSESSPILPGGNKATLTLSDGSTVLLDDVADGTIAEQSGIQVTKTEDGTLVYEVLKKGDASNEINTISTPRGGQYLVILPDGSKAWLNASSSLTYPLQFDAKERKVTLRGEGYFEIAAVTAGGNKRLPFLIELPDQTIEVLGTQFNVNAYLNEEVSKTSLIEGSVKVRTASNSVILKPGQQAQVNQNDNTLGVVAINVDEIASWKNGYFSFQNEKINTIMNEISRWYDVDVEYEGKIKNHTYEGSVSKFKDISEVLEILELTGGVRFKVEGRRVVVMQ